MMLSDIKPNPKNPRVMKDAQYRKLLESVKRDPEFLKFRGIVHANGVILGGNMRYRVLEEATKDPEFRARIGTKCAGEIPDSWVQDASEWTEEQKRRFVLVDNSPAGMSGEWVMDAVLADWSDVNLPDIGFDLPEKKDVETVDERMEIQPYEHYDYLLVLADNVHDWEFLCDKLGIKRVISKEVKGRTVIGLGRCIKAEKLIRILKHDSDSEQGQA